MPEEQIAHQPENQQAAIVSNVSQELLPNFLPNASEQSLALERKLPESHEAYTDKYFLRSKEILVKENLNPMVRAQVFIRQGPGVVRGIEEAVAAIKKYSPLLEHGGSIYAKKEGEVYQSGESVMIIDAPIQDIVELETIYLGIITAETTRYNDKVSSVNLKAVHDRAAQIVKAAEGRPVMYFGARHWHYAEDAAIASAAFDAGFQAASTDVAAKLLDQKGAGTIPHALENIFAAKYGAQRAVVEATRAFDRAIDPAVPRIALIDYNNKEIADSLAVANALQGRLAAVRVDTCGENVAQGALASLVGTEAQQWREQGTPLPVPESNDAKFWVGTGVTITGVYALRKALDAAGHKEVGLYLTSGFGNVEKVAAFTRAEKILGVQLFDALGVGGLYSPCHTSTMDIVQVGDTLESLRNVSKVGRFYRPNPTLRKVL